MNLLRINKSLLQLSKKIRFSFNNLNDTTSLPEETVQIQQAALSFATEKLLPYAGEWDQNHYFPIDVMKEAAQQGFAAIYISPDYGGCGLDRVAASVIFEALSYGCVSTSAYLSIHNMCSWILETFGNEEQKKRWLSSLANLDLFSSYCLTEPNSGSDSKAMKTNAKKVGKDYVINGSKCFISGGSVSDLYFVMCKTNENEVSTIIVEKGTKGLSFGKNELKMGWRSQPTTMVLFDNVIVPEGNLISKPGEGFKIAMKALDGGRINIGSCSLGGAAFAFDQAREYMLDMATSLTSSRLMVRNAARMLDINHPDKSMYAAMAKRYGTDACSVIANEALQIHGGYGYLSEYPIERIVRDLRVHSILEGTNEIMRLIISRQLLKQ